MSAFEEALRDELSWLLRADVPPRAIRLAVREQLVVQLESGPLGAREVRDAMEAAVRAACRLVRELDAPDELVDLVCRSALEAVRGHGGETSRWLIDAASNADAVLDELARERREEPSWRWGTQRPRLW
jgi:hypothetical protein